MVPTAATVRTAVALVARHAARRAASPGFQLKRQSRAWGPQSVLTSCRLVLERARVRQRSQTLQANLTVPKMS
jgi:hypothetical protein